MRYVNTTNGTICSIMDIYSQYPNTSFSLSGPDNDWLEENNFAILIESESPPPPVYKVYEEKGAEKISSEWHIHWLLRDMTTEEIDFYHETIAVGISNYRKSLESTVITHLTHSSYCDKESETGLTECINNIMDSGGEKTISWEGPNGYTIATLEGLQGLRKKVVDYRQKTRDAERLTLEAHGDTPFTSLENALSAFDGYMED